MIVNWVQRSQPKSGGHQLGVVLWWWWCCVFDFVFFIHHIQLLIIVIFTTPPGVYSIDHLKLFQVRFLLALLRRRKRWPGVSKSIEIVYYYNIIISEIIMIK